MNQRKIALFTLCTGIMICGVVLWILINKQQETKREIPKDVRSSLPAALMKRIIKKTIGL